MKTVAIVGTFDSKGKEFSFVKDILQGLGLNTLTIHSGVFEPMFVPDISNEEVAKEAHADIREIASKKDRSLATEILAKGMEKLIPRLYAEGKFDGIISFGGSGGTSIVTPGMRALPIGVPKVMVSTVASGNVSQYVGTSDIMMYPSIVDVSGLNSISTKIFTNAALAIAGMVKYEVDHKVEKKPLIAATMFGLTTPCVNQAREYLEEHGYEVIVFHATGTGGKTMERLIESNYFDGVLDLTTTEWCDELAGGVLNAGPHRLEAAGRSGVPQVVSTGALDMVNFGPFDTVPEKFRDRTFYKHNPTVTLMRTTVQENKELGKIISEKLNKTTSPTALMLPLKGVSGLDVEGQPFYGAEEDRALFDTLRNNIDRNAVELIELDYDINDKHFALAAAKKLIELMQK
ncbi:Tm-1-like ATP-binding domain-containing protein [Paenibacillus apiarius]|uniref:Tm-1-like ATP-binding domain-containing protein n=1 Tax=Paenibacillus apiarius TaxID=46240 RepID=A0ABT4DYF1_9BACL|nr:Tm-1-like ATP-binding domain-containing protein [Paenibacillus apiarius]MCY9512632.1 Tm-1-like ATP-binding domain-containing protein [Paenibacillus apiarius]MCY9522389.1 Tm-1-like ATP-binding domain-containing protein [Paenibacillus apiarius]MCY9553646.1 Tm-1-like ATP-binding domain-containing protein [Paenibacillus apiarius]MCY9556590.1 Tm-1-like ATP-binding domain-containing protein [Paenibacillus apiarius]MCY9682873.1 Tm-1-like ATP-binding domain-containing protein [Paenibacillus apiariu